MLQELGTNFWEDPGATNAWPMTFSFQIFLSSLVYTPHTSVTGQTLPHPCRHPWWSLPNIWKYTGCSPKAFVSSLEDPCHTDLPCPVNLPLWCFFWLHGWPGNSRRTLLRPLTSSSLMDGLGPDWVPSDWDQEIEVGKEIFHYIYTDATLDFVTFADITYSKR